MSPPQAHLLYADPHKIESTLSPRKVTCPLTTYYLQLKLDQLFRGRFDPQDQIVFSFSQATSKELTEEEMRTSAEIAEAVDYALGDAGMMKYAFR